MRRVSVVAAVFMGLAALSAVAAIPAIFFDRDASVTGASGSLLTVAVLNAALAFAVIASWRNRAGLIVIAVLVAGLGLYALEGAASLNTHRSAPGILAPLFWGIVGADAVAALATAAAALVARKTGPVRPAG